MQGDEELSVHPDVITPEDEAERGSILQCFLNNSRCCGPDCTAYVTFPRKGKESELNDDQARCLLLLSAERIGRHVTIIASLMSDAQRRQRAQKAEEERIKAAPPVPSSFSGSAKP